MKSKQFSGAKRQKGNALLTLAIALMLTVILAVYGVPKFNAYLTEGKLPSVAEEIQRFIARMKVNTQGNGDSPYTGLTQATFARAMDGSSLTVATNGTTVTHGMGGGSSGTVVLAETGSAFTLTFNDVSADACPGLPTALQKTVQDISINGTTVKETDANDTITTAYMAGSAAARCVDGDNNTFIFTVR